MLNLDPGMMIWTWITFFLVLFILYKKALRPMLGAIADRERGIKSDLETAAKQRAEAQDLLDQHKKMVADAESEAQRLLKETQELAQKSRSEVLEKAREEASAIVDKARQEIDKQREDAMQSLRNEVVDLAIGAAEKVLAQTMDKEAHKKVVDDYIASMPKSVKN